MSNNDFFESSREQSQVKSEIVAKYFWAWANVMKGVATKSRIAKIAYVDLFSGPGYYQEDCCPSTPILILDKVINDETLSWVREHLIAIFNDQNRAYTDALEQAINELPGIERLREKPQVWNLEVGDRIRERLSALNLFPTLLFADPWGYKGLSLRLIASVLENWGCDCIVFFNYNRVNMALDNPIVKERMDDLFGKARAQDLRSRLDCLAPEEREAAIVEEMAEALKDLGGKYVLPFRFRNERSSRTSHYLIFVSKHFRGYEIMKDIMAPESSSMEQGIASFEYSPATERQPLLAGLLRPLDELGDMLCRDFSGQTLTMRQIYERHSVGTPYTAKNYKSALIKLEANGRITTYSAKRRPKNTFGDDVKVTFP